MDIPLPSELEVNTRAQVGLGILMSFHCNDTVMIVMCYWTGYLATVVEVPSGDDEYYTVSLVEQPEKLLKFTVKGLVSADKDIKKLQVCGKIVL